MAGTYRHFTLTRVADGAWAAIHRTEPPAADAWAVSNAGIVDLGDRTIVFDALMTPAAAQELRAAAETLTGRAPSQVILSHTHNDHVWGAGAFAGIPLLSTTAARDELAAEGAEEIEDHREVAPARVAKWEAAAASDDAALRADAAFMLPYWRGIAATVPTLDLRLPDAVIDECVELRGSGRRVEVVPVGRAHTAGDLMLVLPDDGVVFAGDVLFTRCHPFLADGELAGLRAALASLEATGAPVLVPGHGPIGRPADVATLRGYLDDVERLAPAGPGTAIPDAYVGWGLRPFFAANLAFAVAGGA